jgi:hypothetical protein
MHHDGLIKCRLRRRHITTHTFRKLNTGLCIGQFLQINHTFSYIHIRL